jgi:hypothetical protein
VYILQNHILGHQNSRHHKILTISLLRRKIIFHEIFDYTYQKLNTDEIYASFIKVCTYITTSRQSYVDYDYSSGAVTNVAHA